MLKNRFFISIISLTILLIGVVYSYIFYQRQLSLYSGMINRELEFCSTQLADKIIDFESRQHNLFAYPYSNNSDESFSAQEYTFLSDFSVLVNSLHVVDTLGNNLSFYYKFGDVTVSKGTLFNEVAFPKSISFISVNQVDYLVFPLLNSDRKPYYHFFEINISSYVLYYLDKYNFSLETTSWLIDDKGRFVYSNAKQRDDLVEYFDLNDKIEQSLNNKTALKHKIKVGGKKYTLISVFSQLSFYDSNFTLALSISRKSFVYLLLRNILFFSVLSVIVFSVLIVFSFFFIERQGHTKSLFQKTKLNFYKLLQEISIPIIINNKDGFLEYANQSAKNYFSLKDEISTSYLLKIAPHTNGKFSYLSPEGEKKIFFKNDIKFDLFGSEIPLSVIIDYTETEKIRERERNEAQTKADFLARISHEIRTPLNGVIGLTNNILTTELNEEQLEDLLLIKKSSDLLLNILNDVLDVSKIEANKMKLEEVSFNLFEAIESTLKLFIIRTEEIGISLKLTVSDDLPNRIIGDHYRLKQIINNIIGNSIKFTSKGEIDLNVDLIGIDNGYAYLRFLFEDSGIGIAKDQIDTILKSYVQGNNAIARLYGGSGLGLSITKHLVEMMGGNLVISSPSSIGEKYGTQGTSVSFVLKLFVDNSIAYKEDKMPYTGNNIIVNDISNNSVFTDHYKKLFSDVKITKYVVSSVNNLIDEINSDLDKDNCQVILVEHSQQTNGIEIASKIKGNINSHNVIIIMISRELMPVSLIECRKKGIDFVYYEPFDFFELLSDLSSSLGTKIERIEDSKKKYNLPKTLKILLAEDNIINQKVALGLFKNLGYTNVDVVVNGEEAVEKALQNNYDFIFMDIVMPVMDGNQATKELRNKGVLTPIIAMTANVDSKDIAESLNIGVNAYITKPVTKERIKQFISDWVSNNK